MIDEDFIERFKTHTTRATIAAEKVLSSLVRLTLISKAVPIPALVEGVTLLQSSLEQQSEATMDLFGDMREINGLNVKLAGVGLSALRLAFAVESNHAHTENCEICSIASDIRAAYASNTGTSK